MLNFNEKIIFNKLFIDVTKFLLLISLSLSLIIWVVQAVNFLDYISEDGHGLKTYFSITLLSFPKIFFLANKIRMRFTPKSYAYC